MEKTRDDNIFFKIFILVFVLSLLFYILAAGGAKLPGLPFLPISALMGFHP